MHMVVHLLVQESSQNNSIKCELDFNLRFHFKKHEKLQKCGEKDAFDIAVDGSLDDAIKGTPLDLKFGSLHIVCILYRAEQIELSIFSN